MVYISEGRLELGLSADDEIELDPSAALKMLDDRKRREQSDRDFAQKLQEELNATWEKQEDKKMKASTSKVNGSLDSIRAKKCNLPNCCQRFFSGHTATTKLSDRLANCGDEAGAAPSLEVFSIPARSKSISVGSDAKQAEAATNVVTPQIESDDSVVCVFDSVRRKGDGGSFLKEKIKTEGAPQKRG